MSRSLLLLATSSVCLIGLAAPGVAAAQDLTPVQMAFVQRKPVTMVPAVEEAVSPTPALVLDLQQATAPVGQGAVPTPQGSRIMAQTAPTLDFKPAKFGKVLQYALQLTFYEHVMRVAAQDFTRVELQGPFFRDWFDSVHLPKQWGDGDTWQVNYLGHAIHGSAAVRIWLDQRERKATTKKQYFASMGRAYLFSVIFSEQYEIGPMSEASIGNVGLRAGRTGWVDQVWTPIGAVLWAMAEDAIDKYVLTQVDKHVPFIMARAAARMILNPGRMLGNIGQNRVPWARTDRPISAGLTIGR